MIHYEMIVDNGSMRSCVFMRQNIGFANPNHAAAELCAMLVMTQSRTGLMLMAIEVRSFPQVTLGIPARYGARMTQCASVRRNR